MRLHPLSTGGQRLRIINHVFKQFTMRKKLVISISCLLIVAIVTAQSSTGNTSFTLSLDSFSAKISRQTSPQIIDARSAEEFALNHINGAVNLNVQTPGYEKLLQGFDQRQPVFVYSIATGRSGQLAKELRSKGFAEVYDLKGGIANWIGGGKPYYTSVKNSVTLEEFRIILANNKLVLADIGSRYCGACKKVKPVLDSLHQEYGAELKIVEIDLEASPQLIAELETVDAFPYLVLYRGGQTTFRRSGLVDLKRNIDEAIAKAR